MKVHTTERGFDIATFTDTYGIECSLQVSSIATESWVWLGATGSRMHLNDQMVDQLIEQLVYWKRTRCLKFPDDWYTEGHQR